MLLILHTLPNLIEIPITPSKFCNIFLKNKHYSLHYVNPSFYDEKYLKFCIWINTTILYTIHVKVTESEYSEISSLIPASTLEDYNVNWFAWLLV